MSALDSSPSGPKTLKVVIVGEANVGKTSMLYRFTEGTFLSQSSISTLETDYKWKMMNDGEGKPYKMFIWDTAGQERFRSVTSSLFHGVAGVMLAFDVADRASFEKIPDWIDLVKGYTFTETPIILVGNKTDLADKRAVTLEEAKKFAQEKNFEYSETSAKDGQGIGDAFELLLRVIVQRVDKKEQQKRDGDKKVRKVSSSNTTKDLNNSGSSSSPSGKRSICVII